MIKNKKLQEKILEMARNDQELRRKSMKNLKNKKLIKQVYICDTKNIKEIKKIIKKFSWPNFDLVGKRASNAFWLLVQHADRDIDFQKKCLELLKKAVKINQAHSKNLAFLTDRLLMAEGKKQKFGTQFIFKNKGLVPHPIYDKKNVNKRRINFGLNTLEKRIEELNKNKNT